MRKLKLLTTLSLSALIFLGGCTGGATTTTTAGGSGSTTTAGEATDVPEVTIAWSNELHTGNMQLAFLKPELFENNPIHLKPIGDKQLELIKDGKRIAVLNFIHSKGGAESATMMTQGHLDLAYGSSTAFIASYDAGGELSILAPIQSGGVSVVAAKDAPYNTFEELVEYAKSNPEPIRGGYHSAVSSPRIVLEYALRDAGVKVSEDAADYEADVLLTDLKGISNLIPALSSKQVELWAGPVPNPQNAEAQGIGKIIAKLDQLPEGKWIDFPCCTLNVSNAFKGAHPEIVSAMMQVTKDISDFAQNNREDTAELMTEFIGLDKEVLLENDTTYTTVVNDHFTDGMATYYEAMTEMGKFSGRLKDKTNEEVLESVFDFSFSDAVNK